MLFNSHVFIFLFLPVVWLGFWLLSRAQAFRLIVSWLGIASLFFYGWWNPVYVPLLLGSILFNFADSIALRREQRPALRRLLLLGGVASNLALLGYFKYAGFLVANVSTLLGTDFELGAIVLPLGISFYTFQQIAYLVDVYRGEGSDSDFPSYLLFVTFFPQLIAGPIVHHKEMMPQFARGVARGLIAENLAIGTTIFLIGLFKKVIFADTLAQYATPVFGAAEQGMALTFFEAWSGALAYTFQLYFDFAGYSDMAIGLGRMFGIRLPLNFFSPYKATSIIDFWRRWHMTLSRFLRDYLYIPLGGSRKGPVRHIFSLFITMLLGGLWHGAGWTFVLWGALHGAYLLLNHGWRILIGNLGWRLPGSGTPIGRGTARLVTFLAVVVGWVLFRAASLDGAFHVLRAMSGIDGFTIPQSFYGRMRGLDGILARLGIDFQGQSVIPVGDWLRNGVPLVALALLLAWYAPNTHQLMIRAAPDLPDRRIEGAAEPFWNRLTWQPNAHWATALVFVAVASLLGLSRVSEFIYYQF